MKGFQCLACKLAWVATLDHLWIHQNARLHDGRIRSRYKIFKPLFLMWRVNCIGVRIRLWILFSFASKFFYLMGNGIKSKDLGFYSCKVGLSSFGLGQTQYKWFIIRDSWVGRCWGSYSGFWIEGFSWAIDITTSVQAELKVLKGGLLLAIDLEISNLEIKMD